MYILASEYEGKKKKVKIMKAGILKDIKIGENRVIATPVEVASLIADGHEVLVQKRRWCKGRVCR